MTAPIEPISPNEGAISAQPPESRARVVNVEIGELILDGFGPMGSRPVTSRQNDSGRQGARRPAPDRPDAARAAAALRRELARELAVAGPEAEQLASAIADAVFRQLTAPPRRSPRGGTR